MWFRCSRLRRLNPSLGAESLERMAFVTPITLLQSGPESCEKKSATWNSNAFRQRAPLTA